MDSYQQTRISDSERTITAKTMDEIRDKLFDLYGQNYFITGHRTVMHGGFLGLFQHSECVAKYVVRNVVSEQEEAERPSEIGR